MRIAGWRIDIAMAALACIAGCAGNGQGLDENGQPMTAGEGTEGGSGGTVTADLQSIQDNVFTPICSKCHIGASAPEGLQLDAAHAYDLLINVPSAEQPTLMRVKPGDPDDSYLVRKCEGLAGIEGGQMPLGETPLPQPTIDAIRQWITNGAPNVSSAAATGSQFMVATTSPADRSVVSPPVRTVVVALTHEADSTLINETTVMLEKMDPSSPMTSTHRVATSAALAELNTRVLLLSPAAPLAPGVYRVTLRGAGGGALADLSASTLGQDVSFEFTVSASE